MRQPDQVKAAAKHKLRTITNRPCATLRLFARHRLTSIFQSSTRSLLHFDIYYIYGKPWLANERNMLITNY